MIRVLEYVTEPDTENLGDTECHTL